VSPAANARVLRHCSRAVASQQASTPLDPLTKLGLPQQLSAQLGQSLRNELAAQGEGRHALGSQRGCMHAGCMRARGSCLTVAEHVLYMQAAVQAGEVHVLKERERVGRLVAVHCAPCPHARLLEPLLLPCKHDRRVRPLLQPCIGAAQGAAECLCSALRSSAVQCRSQTSCAGTALRADREKRLSCAVWRVSCMHVHA
jgi:hypothetical protein